MNVDEQLKIDTGVCLGPEFVDAFGCSQIPALAHLFLAFEDIVGVALAEQRGALCHSRES